MAQTPPKKPKKLATPSTGYFTKPVAEATAGKLYLVRDKDHGDRQPVMWGRDLPYEQAHKLKETVAARQLSSTVRFEEQTTANADYLELAIDPRSPWTPPADAGIFAHTPAFDAAPTAIPTAVAAPVIAQVLSKDPGIAQAQASALAATSGIAAEAQARHERIKAEREAQAKIAAIKPPPMPQIPTPEEAAKEADVELPDLNDLLAGGDLPSADELAAAAADVQAGEAPVNLIDVALTQVCPVLACSAHVGDPCQDPAGPMTHPERIAAGLKALEELAAQERAATGHA